MIDTPKIQTVEVKSVFTKSDLVLRDLDLIKIFPHARVSWSLTH